jgi:hypothetical protein
LNDFVESGELKDDSYIPYLIELIEKEWKRDMISVYAFYSYAPFA